MYTSTAEYDPCTYIIIAITIIGTQLVPTSMLTLFLINLR